MKDYQLMTNEELAVEYMNGSNAAFDLLLERTKDQLFSYILFLVHDEDIANDAFQDTFTKAIIKLQERRYSPNGKFTAWMFRIAHNIVMDNYRHQKKHMNPDVNPENDLGSIESDYILTDCKEYEMSSLQVLDDVKRLMHKLPQAQQEVVYMRFYQELSFKEIAEATETSINTALGRMRYALINMRRLAKENQMSLAV